MTDAIPSFTCPVCGAVSHHPQDVANRYCGRCHTFPFDARHLLAGPVRALTASETFVLKWLAQADSSALGECQGVTLDALIGLDLVQVEGLFTDPYARVSLTALGLATVLAMPPDVLPTHTARPSQWVLGQERDMGSDSFLQRDRGDGSYEVYRDPADPRQGRWLTFGSRAEAIAFANRLNTPSPGKQLTADEEAVLLQLDAGKIEMAEGTGAAVTSLALAGLIRVDFQHVGPLPRLLMTEAGRAAVMVLRAEQSGEYP